MMCPDSHALSNRDCFPALDVTQRPRSLEGAGNLLSPRKNIGRLQVSGYARAYLLSCSVMPSVRYFLWAEPFCIAPSTHTCTTGVLQKVSLVNLVLAADHRLHSVLGLEGV